MKLSSILPCTCLRKKSTGDESGKEEEERDWAVCLMNVCKYILIVVLIYKVYAFWSLGLFGFYGRAFSTLLPKSSSPISPVPPLSPSEPPLPPLSPSEPPLPPLSPVSSVPPLSPSEPPLPPISPSNPSSAIPIRPTEKVRPAPSSAGPTTTTALFGTEENEWHPQLGDGLWSKEKRPFINRTLRHLKKLEVPKPNYDYGDYRLSGDFVPSKYQVRLVVSVRGRGNATKSFLKGAAQIEIRYRGEGGDVLEIHGKGLNIEKASVIRISDKKELKLTQKGANKEKETLLFSAVERFISGESYVLQMLWSAPIRKGVWGLYETWYEREDGGTSVSIASHGQTAFLRQWMPAIDEPAYKASLELSVVHSSELRAISNGEVREVRKADDGRLETFFNVTSPLPTYSFSLSLNDYVTKKADIDGVRVSASVPPPESAKLDSALKAISKAIKDSKKFFKEPPVHKKIDAVFVYDVMPITENSGHFTFSVDLLDDPLGTHYAKILHETVHMWFGDLVTLDWWSDAWISEGLATHHEAEIMNLGDDEGRRRALRSYRDAALSMDVLDSHPALHEDDVLNPIQSLNMINDLSRFKGAAVVQMLREYLGEERWKAARDKFMDRQRANVHYKMFVSYLHAEAGYMRPGFREMAYEWITQVGYPILRVERKDDSVVLIQTRFHRGFNDPTFRDENTRWSIPIFYTINGIEQHPVVFWSDAPNLTIPVPRDAVLRIDPKGAGYYRVVYADPLFYDSLDFTNEADQSAARDILYAAHYGYVDAPLIAYSTLIKSGDESMIMLAYELLLETFSADLAKAGEFIDNLVKLAKPYIRKNKRSIRTAHNSSLDEIEDEVCTKVEDRKNALSLYRQHKFGSKSVDALFCAKTGDNKTLDYVEGLIGMALDEDDDTVRTADIRAVIIGAMEYFEEHNPKMLKLLDFVKFFEKWTKKMGVEGVSENVFKLNMVDDIIFDNEFYKMDSYVDFYRKEVQMNWVSFARLYEIDAARKYDSEHMAESFKNTFRKIRGNRIR